MAEYVERDAIINHLRECEGTPPEIAYTYPIFKAIECFVEELPTADVAPVVRCKDCGFACDIDKDSVWCRNWNQYVYFDHFCSYGERKEGDSNG